MKMLRCIIGLLTWAALSTGCVSVMTRNSFNGTMNSAFDSGNKAQADCKLKSEMYREITGKTSTPRAVPYPEMGLLITKMKAGWDQINLECNVLADKKKKFEDLCEGRPDVSSDRPTWKPFLTVYEDSKTHMAVLNTRFQEYSASSNRFSELAGQYGIRRIDAKEVQGKLAGQLGELDKTTGDIRRQIGEMRAKLNEHTAQTLGLARHQDRHEILNNIEALAAKLEAASASVKGKVGAFDASLKGAGVIWTGPGFPKVEIVDQVAKGTGEISGLVGQINEQAAKWNSLK